MKESRAYTLTVISIILLALSLVSICLWGYYNLFAGNKLMKPSAIRQVPDSAVRPKSAVITESQDNNRGASDSLLALAILRADSMTARYNEKLSEYDSLQKAFIHLADSAKAMGGNDAAREKIRDLNKRIADLESRNQSMERENKQLTIALSRLENQRKRRVAVPLESEPQQPARTAVPTPSERKIINLQNLILSPVFKNGITETETSEASKAEKFAGRFTCRNLGADAVTAEVFLVLKDPQGMVIDNGWESGVFDTEKGRLAYTSKIRFDIGGGESKKMTFNFQNLIFKKGKYSLEAFHRGKSLGQINKILN